MNNIIPITTARRNLGTLVDRLKKEGDFYLLRGGKVAAKLSLPETVIRESRKGVLKKIFGAWKDTDLDSDNLWEEVLLKERIRDSKKPLSL